jgi:Ricin-type beta-trefoil lectin domain-like
MSIHIIQDERDFYEKYTNYLRVQTKLKVSIHGVPDEDKTQIKDTLQDLLTAEVINLEHEKSRARGVSDEILDASDLLPTLKELPLPEKERTVLEAKIHRVARQITSRQAGRSPEAGTERAPPALLLDQRSLGPIVQFSHTWQSHTTMADTCICAASGYPGTDNSLSDLIPFPPYPPGRNYLIVSVFLKGLPWSNAIFLRVEPFSSRPGEMEVGLASEVQWHRKIRAWHLCHEKVASVQQPHPSNTPKYMRLQSGCYGPHTLVFSDGFWNFAHFDDSPFWSVFGGKRLTFYWVEGPFTLPAWMSPRIQPIRAKHSGKVLDVRDVSPANGARIQQYDWLGGNNQRWNL